MFMTKTRPTRVIEFYGAPGVGKSYLARELVSYSKLKGAPLSGRALKINAMPRFSRFLAKLRYIAKFIANSPEIALLIIKFVLEARQTTGTLLVVFNWLYVVAYVKQHSLEETVILDQGLFQAYWSMIYRGAKLDRTKFRTFILRLLDHCGVEELKIIDVKMVQPLHLAQLASRSDGRSPLDSGGLFNFEHGLQVTETVRSVVYWLSGGLSARLSVIRKLNDQESECEDLYQNLMMDTPRPPFDSK